VPGMMRMDIKNLNRVVVHPLPVGFRIRRYNREDWSLCVQLMLDCPDPAFRAGPWDRALCESSLAFSADRERDYPGGRGQLIFREENLVAMALASATGYLNQVYTLAPFRRMGLAGASITAVLSALHQHGVPSCFLMVFQENRVAVECYRNLGFSGGLPPENI
jgi:ribosomal protein S18 acetylase RimI-like enzyme